MSPQPESPETTLLSSSEQQMLDDLTWAGTAAEVLQHTGKFVVIYNRRVVAVGTDRQALVEDAATRLGRPWWGLAVAVVPGDKLLDGSDGGPTLPGV